MTGLLIKLGAAAILLPVLFAATPNIVLITVDTLRADHLHCYGYQQVRSGYRGEECSFSGQPVDVWCALLQVIERSANMTAAYIMMPGRCYFIQERYPDAMKIFVRLQKIDVQSQDAQFYIAACQFRLDELDRAEEGLRKVLAVNSKRTFAHKYLCFVYHAQGKLDLSFQEFQSVLVTSPSDLEAHGKLGFRSRMRRDSVKAAKEKDCLQVGCDVLQTVAVCG